MAYIGGCYYDHDFGLDLVQSANVGAEVYKNKDDGRHEKEAKVLEEDDVGVGMDGVEYANMDQKATDKGHGSANSAKTPC